MPFLPDGLDRRLMVHDDPKTAELECLIVCMTMRVKILLFVFIFVPKIVIAIFLSCVGSVWLMASENVSDLILNSLALSFVTNVDELICTVFFPPFYIRDLNNLTLACQKEDDDIELRR